MIETKYGVISDIHLDSRVIDLAVEILKSQGAEKLLVNGDIGDRKETLQETQDNTAIILNAIGKSGLDSVVQPGSHETLTGYQPVLEYFSGKYNNIFDIQNIERVEAKDHDLIFLPGSDFVAGGEFRIGSGELPSGTYIKTDEGLLSGTYEQYHYLLSSGRADEEELKRIQGIFKFQNIGDLRKYVAEPEKTIMVCHVPRKFDNLETAVDMAEFGEATENFNLNGNGIEKGSIFPKPVAENILSGNPELPISLKKENRGNGDLKNLYEELGITKAVTGHFHESGHRANDSYGNNIQEGEFVTDLFWNSGYLDVGQTGILTVKGNQVSYRNIRLQDYTR